MKNYKILVVVGSLRKDSFNLKLSKALIKMAPSNFTFTYAEIRDLPLYNQDDDANQAASVKRLKNEVLGADAILFVTPEYNRSIPGVLKNAIDNASRPWGQNSWAQKPAAIIGVSVGALGTALAQQHLRNMLAYLDMPVLAQPEAFIHAKPELFDEHGDIGPNSQKFLAAYMDNFANFVRKHVET